MREYRLISPERVQLDLELAGLGSRFAAAFADGIVKGILIIFFIVAASLLSGLGAVTVSGWRDMVKTGEYVSLGGAFTLLIIFGIVYGYSILFETIWNGQTPGKRLIKIRVVQKNGSPVTFTQVLVRNMFTIIDQLPFFYTIGIISIFLTRRNQRLGDLAAGTVVLREKSGRTPAVLDDTVPEAAWAGTAGLHLHTVTEAEFSTLKQYLLRKDTLRPEEALALEQKLAAHFRGKLGIEAEESQDLYVFLRQVAQLYQTKG